MANLSWVSLFFLLFFNLCQSNNAKGLSFRLILSDSLTSPMDQVNYTIKQKIERLVHLSEARAKSLNSSISRQDNNIRPPLRHEYNHHLFLIQVGIGTFSDHRKHKTYYLVLDTASGPIWTQCDGCNPCFYQKDPVFPRTRSSSYREFTCQNCPPDTKCEQNRCVFNFLYGDDTQTHVKGIAAIETFSFGSGVGSPMPKWNLSYGCVIYSQNFIPGMDRDNIISGIFGLGPEPLSFMGQVGSHFGGRFSYCLTPIIHQSQSRHMFLRFGNDIPPLGPSLHQRYQTPLIRGSHPFYYLDLQAISLGSKILNINKIVFQIRRDGSGGCFIDTGSGNSLLIKAAYTKLKEILTRKTVAKNPGVTVDFRDPVLCYKNLRPEFKFPKLVFHFANDTNFVIEHENYMADYEHEKARISCLMIQPSDTFTVLGAYQQVNHRIIYDTINSKLKFASAKC